MKRADCPHFTAPEVPARGKRCGSCDSGFNLRACTTCGHVGCCESQQGHNTAHAKAEGHAVIRAVTGGGGEGWLWCYQCNDYLR